MATTYGEKHQLREDKKCEGGAKKTATHVLDCRKTWVLNRRKDEPAYNKVSALQVLGICF